MDVAAWLRGLGLEQYAQLFRDNDIDGAILCGMTAEDLKELGISSFGHRRKLLNAITALGGALGGEPPTRDMAQSATSATPAPIPPPTIEAERRQLTVMFCDLVGSTSLSTRFDPEDLREVIGAYQRVVTEIVSGFDGFVAKYMGDGVLVYFGYPRAHEDDAERAVRTGLALAERVARLETHARLEARIGIATGLVVVGDLIGAGEAQERGVGGETPNLAARMQELAPANGVLIAEGTRRLLGDFFELRDLGIVAVKGFAASLPVWQVLRPSAVESRFDALRASALTPLVGREEELELLLQRWQRAKAGDGQVVLLSGEPGIGKSRLTAALHQRLEGEPHIRLRYFCSPHHQDSALYPFITQLERAAGFTHEDSADARLDKLEGLLTPAAPPAEDLTLLAELLSLPTVRYLALPLSPQRKKERTFAALRLQLADLARCQSVLMVFEDLHWIDPSSRELLDLIVERALGLPMLLILTFRPEFQAPWSGLPQVAALALNRLDPRTGAAMIERIAGDRPLPTELMAEIVERADGVPLFVEELARAVIETGASSDRGIDKTLAGSPLPASTVPAALHASLLARLDRLGPAAREVAQIGAVIGRDFPYALLVSIAAHNDATLANALDRLTQSGLIFQRGTTPSVTFLFKHALVRDAAYASLLRRRRQELHARIAALLEAGFPEIVEAQPELLAQHFTEAGLIEQGIAYWQRAGERAVVRSANIEAVTHFGRGIALLKTLPESAQRDEQELALQVAIVAPLLAIRGLGAPETERAGTRSLELSRQVGADTPAHFGALNGMVHFYVARGVLPLARETWARKYFAWPNVCRTRSCVRTRIFCSVIRYSGSANWLLRGTISSRRSRFTMRKEATLQPCAMAIILVPILTLFSGAFSGISAIPTRRCCAPGRPSRLPKRSRIRSAKPLP
jgi:class 3 adenylate cyclase